MSTVAALDRTHQHLIDLRLDSLDRILMDSGVSRSERAEIVQAVEDQIFEMLDQQGEEVTRESVLQLLRSLDPPEAYCGEEAVEKLVDRTRHSGRRNHLASSQSQPSSSNNSVPPRHSGLAIAALVLALISIPTVIVFPVGGVFAFASFVCAIIALPGISASGGQLRGGWMAFFGCGMFTLHFFATWCFMFMMG